MTLPPNPITWVLFSSPFHRKIKARQVSTPVRRPPALLTAEPDGTETLPLWPQVYMSGDPTDHLSLLDILGLFLDFTDKQLCVASER